MSDRELQVGFAHGLEAGSAAALLFPCINERAPECTEAFPCDRRDKRLLVGEMAIQRGS